MEVLYCIITILFIIACIILMLLLFFKKPRDRDDGTKRVPFAELTNKLKGSRNSNNPINDEVSDNPGSINYEYEVHYKGKSKLKKYFLDRESCNETIDEDVVLREPSVALNLKVTSDRHSSIKTQAQIWDDEIDENGKSKLEREGVLFGGTYKNTEHSDCDYWMRSPQMSHTGSFGLKRKGDRFVIFGLEKTDKNGNVKSVMVRETMNGEKKKRIVFSNKGVCYVGDIRFEFEVPGQQKVSEKTDYQVVRFYDETLDESITEDQTRETT